MKSQPLNERYPVFGGARIGLITGAFWGFVLGELGGYLNVMSRWMTNTHDYQIARQTKGVFIALVSHSGTALESALLMAVFCGVFSAMTGLITGIGTAVLGLKTRTGFEWVIINITGVALVLLILNVHVDQLLFILFASPVIASWIVVRAGMRRFGQRQPQGPIQSRTLIGYLLAIALIASVAYMLFMLFAAATRV